MLKEKDRAYIAQLASEDTEIAYVVHLLEEDHREMLSMLSHEIRNPLTLISSTLQLIEQSHPETKEFRFWHRVQEDIWALSLLLNDLSAYNNAFRLQLKQCDLLRLTADVLHSFLPELDSRNIRLEFPDGLSAPETCLYIQADPIKLRQVLVNLLKNATEALQGLDNGIICIDIRTSGTTISLSVTDNGCGIPSELLEAVFQPFQTFKSSGTGLGLPLSRQILRAHGGDLTAESVCISDSHENPSSAGKHRTTFTMTLQCVIN